MSENVKIKPAHLARTALVYVRQSTASQMERNQESTDRQYRLVERALEFGWSREQIVVIDEDLGRTGSGIVERTGFEKMTSEVALGRVGIIFGLEVSRLARNNADWYRLLDLAGMTDTVIADADGVYHPGLFNDRLVLGLKGTMSEAELHVIRARLDGGIRNKAARGELRRGLPVGFVWGEREGEIRFHPDEAVRAAIENVFARFAEMGSARRVWLWFRSEGLSFPHQASGYGEVRWVAATYPKIHQVLRNPVYAGVYAYGRKRSECYVDAAGRIRRRMRHLPRAEWQVFIRDHHEGFIDWATYESNQARLGSNTRPRPHQAGGAVREGAALLQGIAICGSCGRRLRVYYHGKNSTPGYHCPGNLLVDGRNSYCLRVGGCRIDNAVARVFLDAISPAGIEAVLKAEATIDAEHDAVTAQWRLEVERTRYDAQRAERRYRAVEPENRLVARGLEKEWEAALKALSAAEIELVDRENQRRQLLTEQDRAKLRALGSDVSRVWSAPSTSDRDRKELLRTLLEEVTLNVQREESKAHLTLRWRGGALTEIEVELQRRTSPLRTSEETVELVRRLAAHYPDAVIAGILNRQGRLTSHGDRFTTNKVAALRRTRKIPKFEVGSAPTDGELVTLERAAATLRVGTSTLHRWLADGTIAGEQVTPGAPWRIRLTEEVRARFAEDERDGYVPMSAAVEFFGVTRQTIMYRVKRGELEAIYVPRGTRKELRIKLPRERAGQLSILQTVH